ncbi:AAA family ATPase [bacterium]|nr:AAA family ATPase [bacterium]
MRIDRLRIQNFKQFAELELELDPQFNLLVGENGAGKTSVLEALTVALGVFLVKPPDPELNVSRRNIYKHEIRLEAKDDGDRLQFYPCRPVRVEAEGEVLGLKKTWTRKIGEHSDKTSNQEANDTVGWITKCYELDRQQRVIFPVLGYYGAGRAWLPSNERPGTKANLEAARRWSAFYDCFSERVHFAQLTDWFRREAMAALTRRGQYRRGYEVVQQALVRCVPGAERAWFDADRQEIVLSIAGETQPMGNLSAGQRMMLAMVSDLAIKAVTQNNSLLTEEELSNLRAENTDPELPYVLRRTPGVVLIDELDVHLHPLWQRRVIEDLTRTFPLIQFVATTHSPFIIQSLGRGKLLRMGAREIAVPSDLTSLEDIAEVVQGVESPQQSMRSRRLEQATEKYFALLAQKNGVANSQLRKAEREFREASIGFTNQPGLEALLKMQAMVAEAEGE